jgi:hypothetical protein
MLFHRGSQFSSTFTISRGDRGAVQLAFMMGDTASCGHAYVMAITNSAIGDPLGPSMTRPPTEAATKETPRRSAMCRGLGQDAAPRRCSSETAVRMSLCASHRLPTIVQHLLERRTVAIALRHLRRLQSTLGECHRAVRRYCRVSDPWRAPPSIRSNLVFRSDRIPIACTPLMRRLPVSASR